MSEQDKTRPEDEDVEGHGLKEVLATGAAAGALLGAGAGTASAQLPIGDSGASAGARSAPSQVDPGPSGGTGSQVQPGPSGGTGSQVQPGPSGGKGSQADPGPSGGKGSKAKDAKKAPAKKRGGR